MSGLEIGQHVELADGRHAVVKFIGQPHFAAGDWIGVELADDSGKNDGSVQGERYFECAMGRGMFLRPSVVTILEQQPAPSPKPATRKPARPSSAIVSRVGRRMSVMDSSASKRSSMNSASPSPATRRPSSMLRSPTKSPTKQLGLSTSAGSTNSRTSMSSARNQSVAANKSKPATAGSRSSMGPPAPPPNRASRQSLSAASGVGGRPGASPARNSSVPPKTSLAPRPGGRPATQRPSSNHSQLSALRGGGQNNNDTLEEEGQESSTEQRSTGALSPTLLLSPTISRTAGMEKYNVSPSSSRGNVSPGQRAAGSATALSREVEDLKTKLRLMEKKRLEDRDKLKGLERIQAERDKFESIIQKLQAKYQPQQQELTDLRKQLKESATQFEEIEKMQTEHELVLEMATLDREMAEETAEVLKTELEALKQKTEELELEVEVLREENAELGGEMSPEEKASQGWLQMERNNERLREALIRLRDITQQQEADLRDEIKSLEEDVRDLGGIKEQYDIAKEKLAQSESVVEDLRQQVDNALGAEDMIEELTERNMSMSEQIEEMRITIEDLESLKELNDELEINHVETEKEMQEDLDFKDSLISEQARRAAQQEEALEDMEYTLSRFRELVTSLQSDLEDIRASHAVTETESEQLNSRTRAMQDLNLKLQLSAAKTQVKTIDLELRRLDAQEASEHLSIVQLFLPEAFHADRDSVLALLRFKRVEFKANLIHGFIKEKVNGQLPQGHEDDVFAACDVLDKLTWVGSMCDRFVNAISHCSVEQFAKYEGALYELEPVERALNAWVDGLRRDELNEKKCASELSRTIALMSHLAEVHISNDLESYADDVHMRVVVMQSSLENTASALNTARVMVLNIIQSKGDEDVDDLAQYFARKTEAVIGSTRSAKVIAGKAVRSLEDLKYRSLSLNMNTVFLFEQCEETTQELAKFARQVGTDLFTLLHEEGRVEPFTYTEVQGTIYQTTSTVLSSSESDIFSIFSSKLRLLTDSLNDLAGMASDLEMTTEFERASAPWVLRSQDLRSSRIVPIDTEEEMRRLKEELHERARLVALKDQTLEESIVKIELLESRMRDAAKKNERITELEKKIEEAKKREADLSEAMENQNKEIMVVEADREKWRKLAGEQKAIGEIAPGSKAGQERAVATAREMEALKAEIASLQAAVRYLREDNRRARLTEPRNQEWLSTPLSKPKPIDTLRKEFVVSEGRDVLDELLNLTKSAKLYDLGSMPENRLAWRPAKSTPQYHVAKQRENYEAWNDWRQAVVKKGEALTARDANRGTGKRRALDFAAKVHFSLPELSGKGFQGEVEIVEPGEFEEFRERLGFA